MHHVVLSINWMHVLFNGNWFPFHRNHNSYIVLSIFLSKALVANVIAYFPSKMSQGMSEISSTCIVQEEINSKVSVVEILKESLDKYILSGWWLNVLGEKRSSEGIQP